MQALDTLFQGPVAVDSVITSADLDPAVEADTGGVSVTEATGQAVGQIQAMVDGFFEALPRVAVAVVVFLVIWLIAAGVRKLVHRVTPGPRDSSIGTVLGRLAYAALIIFGVFVALTIVIPSLKFSSIVAGLGLGGVAFAFAFQDTFQNLLAGILILLREPFREGDEITSGQYTGTVEAIETRATFIRTYDGQRVIIPNSQIYSDPVVVITAYNLLRSQYDVGIGYGDDIEEAKRIALDAVKGIDGVLDDPAPDVLTWDLAGSSVNLRVRWWSKPARGGVVGLRDQVLIRVSQALLGAGIDLPFPTQQVLFHDQTEATDGDRTKQREGWPAPPDGSAPDPARIGTAISEAGGDGAPSDGPDRPAPAGGADDGAGGADDGAGGADDGAGGGDDVGRADDARDAPTPPRS